jgi:hypothetical protein
MITEIMSKCTVEITRSFHKSAILLNIIIKNQYCEEAIVVPDQETNEDDMIKRERVVDQVTRKFLLDYNFYFTQDGNENRPLSVPETYAIFFSCGQSREHCWLDSIPLSLTVKKSWMFNA